MEKTECYKCQTEIEAPEGVVHPLCEKCQASFDEWFQQALGGRA